MSGSPERPGRIRAELSSLKALAADVTSSAEDLAREYEEAHDAYMRSYRSGVRTLPHGGAAGDPTGETALSPDYARMQSALGFVGRRISSAHRKMAAARHELERALGSEVDGLHGAWLDTDPDLRRDRRERRAAALAAVNGTGAGVPATVAGTPVT